MTETYDWHEVNKQMEEERKERFEKILSIAKRMCPVEYKKLVHAIFIEVGTNYSLNEKRGVYSKELDSLIGVGKLKLSADGKVAIESE